MSRFRETVTKIASSPEKTRLFTQVPSALLEKNAAPVSANRVLAEAGGKLIAGAALGLGSFALSKAYDKFVGNRMREDEHQRELGKLTAQSDFKALNDMRLKPLHESVFKNVMQDPVIKDADPSLMHSTFDTMKRFAPNLAADNNAAKSFLREHAIYGSGPSYAALKNLADAEQAISRSGGALAKTADWRETAAENLKNVLAANFLLNTAGKPGAVMATHALAGAVPGAIGGAMADDDSRLRGAVLGGLVGAGLGTGVGGANLAVRDAVERGALEGLKASPYLQASSLLSPAVGATGGTLAGVLADRALAPEDVKTADWRNALYMAGTHAVPGAVAGALGGGIGAESGHRLEGALRGAAMGGALGGLSGGAQYGARRLMGQNIDSLLTAERGLLKAIGADDLRKVDQAVRVYQGPRLDNARQLQLAGTGASTALGGLGSMGMNWGLGREQ